MPYLPCQQVAYFFGLTLYSNKIKIRFKCKHDYILFVKMLQNFDTINYLRKIKGLILVGLGFLLSPLSWWNDLLFNLPLAYFFGYICSQFSANLFLPCAIAGYWLSNVLGILLMQIGLSDVVQEQPQEQNLKKQLLMGLASSTVYTVIILLLLQFNILNTPDLLAEGQSFSFKAFLPI